MSLLLLAINVLKYYLWFSWGGKKESCQDILSFLLPYKLIWQHVFSPLKIIYPSPVSPHLYWGSCFCSSCNQIQMGRFLFLSIWICPFLLAWNHHGHGIKWRLHPNSPLWVFEQAWISFRLARQGLPATAKQKLNLKHQVCIHQEEGVWKVGLGISECWFQDHPLCCAKDKYKTQRRAEKYGHSL